MDINTFSLYSKLSAADSSHDESVYFDILLDIGKISQFDKAKECLESYGIKDNVANFSFGKNHFISVNEKSKIYTVRFDYDNKHVIYNYNK